jgi:excisionase family DNA binding protein
MSESSDQTRTQLVRVTDVAAMLSLSRVTIYKLLREGELVPIRLTPNSDIRVDLRDVERLIERRRAAAAHEREVAA